MATPQEFSKRIKEKYPQYAQVDDYELAKRMVEKYPQYADKVSFEPQTIAGKASSMVQGLAKPFVDITTPLTNPIAQRLQQGGEAVNRSVQGVAGRVAESGNPVTATGMSLLGDIGQLTPQNASIAIGSELVPALNPLQGKVQSISKGIGNRFLGTPAKQIKKSVRSGSLTPGEELISGTKLRGSREEVLDQAANKVKDIESKVQSTISKSADKPLNRDEIVSAVDDVITDLKKTGLDKSDIRVAERLKKDFVESHPESAPVSYWNEVKREIYKKTGDKGYITKTPTTKVEIQKQIASRIKQGIEKVAPELKKLNSEQAKYIRIRDSLIESSPREARDINLLGGLKEEGSLDLARGRVPFLPFLPKVGLTPRGTSGLALPIINERR